MCSMTVKRQWHARNEGRATYSVQSIQESVEEVGCGNFLWLVDLIINLVQRNILRVEQGEAGIC
jgi:hypothetical protein